MASKFYMSEMNGPQQFLPFVLIIVRALKNSLSLPKHINPPYLDSIYKCDMQVTVPRLE